MGQEQFIWWLLLTQHKWTSNATIKWEKNRANWRQCFTLNQIIIPEFIWNVNNFLCYSLDFLQYCQLFDATLLSISAMEQTEGRKSIGLEFVNYKKERSKIIMDLVLLFIERNFMLAHCTLSCGSIGLRSSHSNVHIINRALSAWELFLDHFMVLSNVIISIFSSFRFGRGRKTKNERTTRKLHCTWKHTELHANWKLNGNGFVDAEPGYASFPLNRKCENTFMIFNLRAFL